MAPSPRAELAHNTELIADPVHCAREPRAASRLYLFGEEFADTVGS